MAEWYERIESKVFTQVQYMLKQKFPTLKCTTQNEAITPAEFPTMYLSESQKEIGQDLFNGEVAAVNSTISVRVWTNTTEKDCKAILNAAATELKRFHYNIGDLPTAKLSNQIAFGEIMAKRVIANADDIAQ